MTLPGHILPSVFVDNILESTFSGLLVANDVPERDSIGADSGGALRLDILCTNGNNVDDANTDIFVEGTQAYQGGTGFINGYTGTKTHLPITGPLLADWQMEETGTSSWTAVNAASLSKQPGSPGGIGSQVLRIAHTSIFRPGAQQAGIVTSGITYRVSGYARSDGSATPQILFGAVIVWTGTNSHTNWQTFDFEVTSTVTGTMTIEAVTGVPTQYAEFDDVKIHELGPDFRWEIQSPTTWASEDLIAVRVISQDDGGPVDTLIFSYTFTVEDTTAPTITSVVARDHSTLRVTFSEPMTAVSASATGDALNPASYGLEFIPANDRQAAVWAVVSSVALVTTSSFDLTVDMPLTFSKTYRLSSTAQDASGNPLSSIANTIDFTSWEPPGWEKVNAPDFYLDFFSQDMRDRDTGDFERLCSILQDTWEYMIYDAFRFPADVFDHSTAREDQVDADLADMGNPFKFDLTLDRKRSLLELLTQIYKLKGTEPGIILLSRFFTDVVITDVRPYTETSWIMGVSLLGVDTFMGPSLEANLYSFEVIVDQALTDEERNQLISLIDYIKVAHEHAFIVEPATPTFIDHWDLSQSELGVNTWLH
jgi:phage tail-like protein